MASFGDLNIFACVGRLTRDPELNYTASGTPVCRLGIAVNRSYKSGEEIKEDVLFINAVSWGKQGENCAKYLTKGRRVAINGELRGNNWTDKEGNKRYGFEVNINTIQFLGTKNNNSPSTGYNTGQNNPAEEENPEDVPF